MTGQPTDLSFRRIADIPFDAYMAMLESWQLTGQDGELRLGNSLVRGPIEHDQHFGIWRVEVRLGCGRLRPAVQMRLEIAAWYAGATVLELMPCKRVWPSAAYFAAGDRLLASLARMLPVRVPVPQHADEDYLRATVSAGVPALSGA